MEILGLLSIAWEITQMGRSGYRCITGKAKAGKEQAKQTEDRLNRLEKFSSLVGMLIAIGFLVGMVFLTAKQMEV